METNKKHFVLVHGACHGAWCWYKVVTLLKSAGHRVTALDLGASGINPKLLDELKSISDYAQPLIEFLASLPHGEKVILVCHSYSGMITPLAMEQFPAKISVAVFVTSYMPNCIDPPASQAKEFFRRKVEGSLLDCNIAVGPGPENLPQAATFGSNYIEKVLYKNCQQEDVELAKILVRPFKFFLEDLSKNSLLTEANYGSVKRVYIVCKEDSVMEEEFQLWIVDNSPTKDVKYISGAAHMVMLSKPREFFQCLQGIADKYN